MATGSVQNGHGNLKLLLAKNLKRCFAAWLNKKGPVKTPFSRAVV
jgi:hypothetical protein